MNDNLKGLEFSIARDILYNAVQTVATSVAGKATSAASYPGSLLIAADDSGLSFRAADAETFVSLQVQGALVTTTGRAVVTLALLKELVTAFPAGGRVDVSAGDGGRTTVTCGRSKSTLTAPCEPEAFPLGHEPEGEGIPLDRQALIEALAQVSVAANRDDSRPALTGVCFEFSEDALTLVAVDGFRLAVRSLPLAAVHEEAKALLPAVSLNRLVRVLSKLDAETVTLYTMDGRVVFQAPVLRMEMLTIEERFPNWQQIVPESHTASISVDPAALRATLRQARLFPAGEGYKKTWPIKVEYLNSGQNTLRISAANSELGSYTATVPVTGVEGEPVALGLNAAFLLEMLPKLNGTLQMRTNGDSSPVVFADTSLTYVVMPLVLRGS